MRYLFISSPLPRPCSAVLRARYCCLVSIAIVPFLSFALRLVSAATLACFTLACTTLPTARNDMRPKVTQAQPQFMFIFGVGQTMSQPGT